jgi:hypothetical protein
VADPLTSARMKLQRAEEHHGELLREHAAFLNRNPYRMLRENDIARGDQYYLWRAKVVEHPPYEKWATLIGECVHSLRATLDHTAYVIVNRERHVTERCGFPILEKPESWNSTHPDYLPGVSPTVLALVEELQPYQRQVDRDPLWAVHRLDIIDKHRRLGLVNSTVEGTTWRAVGGEMLDVEGGVGPFEDGSIVARFKLVPDEGGQVQMLTEFHFGIALAKGEPGEKSAVLPLLEHFRSYVGGVLALFEPLL